MEEQLINSVIFNDLIFNNTKNAIENGGKGSGNFGHSGRDGIVGGSGHKGNFSTDMSFF